MADAIRDVTIRVSVEPGDQSKMLKFDQMTIEGDKFVDRTVTGLRTVITTLGDVETATGKVRDSFSSVAQMELPDDRFDGMASSLERVDTAITAVGEGFSEIEAPDLTVGPEAATSMEAVVTATEGVTDAMQTATAATEAAGQASVAASAEMATATAGEGKTASEIMIAKIRMSERLAAFNRKAADEVKKQSIETATAAKKSGEEAQHHMFAAGRAIGESLAAGAMFVSTLRLIGGESKEIEELARTFATVQMTVQGISAGTRTFNNLSVGLKSLQAAAAAAGISIATTGTSATATQSALLFLAPAAATAQAALGPIALAVGGIALAITGVMAVSSFLEDDVPTDADKTTRAFERTNEQLDRMKRQLDANVTSMKNQNAMLRIEMDLRQTLDGTATTAPAIEERREASIQTATGDANAKIKKDRTAILEEVRKLKEQRSALSEENKTLQRESPGTKETIEKQQDNGQKIGRLAEQIWEKEDALRSTKDLELTPGTTEDFMRSIEGLSDEIRAEFETTRKELISATAEANREAMSASESATRDNEAAIKENTQKQKEMIDAYNVERDIAVGLQNDPTQRREIEQNINMAAATGNLTRLPQKRRNPRRQENYLPCFFS